MNLRMACQPLTYDCTSAFLILDTLIVDGFNDCSLLYTSEKTEQY